LPTPTPPTTFIPGVVQPTPATRATATPTRRRGRGTPTPSPQIGKPLLNKPQTGTGTQANATPKPSRRGNPTPKIIPKKRTSKPSPTPYQIR
jgi:hypothetical protein